MRVFVLVGAMTLVQSLGAAAYLASAVVVVEASRDFAVILETIAFFVSPAFAVTASAC